MQFAGNRAQPLRDLLLLRAGLVGKVGLGLVQEIPGVRLHLGGDVGGFRLGRLGDGLGGISGLALHIRGLILGHVSLGGAPVSADVPEPLPLGTGGNVVSGRRGVCWVAVGVR